jgi:hypothetical protein
MWPIDAVPGYPKTPMAMVPIERAFKGGSCNELSITDIVGDKMTRSQVTVERPEASPWLIPLS